MIKDLNLFYQMNQEVIDRGRENDGTTLSTAEVENFLLPETKVMIMQCLLHNADISNPSRKWEAAYAWSRRVIEEFFAQGDEEKRLSIPVQFLNDREKLNVPQSQIGFIEFMM